jgi:hypothetical protein
MISVALGFTTAIACFICRILFIYCKGINFNLNPGLSDLLLLPGCNKGKKMQEN